MMLYRFKLELAGDVEGSLDALYEAGWDDAGVTFDPTGCGTAEFDREASDAITAIVSAIEQAEVCGIDVLGVAEDLVMPVEIAERVGRTVATVDYWTRGLRGPGKFPEPRIRRSRGSLYSWAEVTAWLAEASLVELPAADVEAAEACAVIDAALKVRRRLRALPADERRLVSALVA